MNKILFLLAAIVIAIDLSLRYRRRTRSQQKKQASIDLSARTPPPRRSGMSAEEIIADESRYLAEVHAKGKSAFERDRNNAITIGSKYYIWRTCGDGSVCDACAKNEGLRFSWKRSPSIGHPGFHLCSTDQPCRCYAETVIPD
ncbi:Putative bacteriophage protein [Burkholderia glumae BGR1]|nr:Putative bacteriophage protein [Burkholderia glumae BGR1]